VSRLLALLFTALAICLVTACGDDDDDSSGADSDAPTKLAVKVTEVGKGSRLSVPKSLEAGPATVSLRNAGKAPHDAQIIRVEGDQTVDQVLKAIDASGEGKPLPAWMRAAGGVGTVAPGKSATATDLLQPGKHFVLDTEPDRNGGTAEFQVTGEAGGELPGAPVTISAKEYGFVAEGLKAGTARFTFDNVGKEPHHVIAAPYAKGATLAEVRKALSDEEAEFSGPPPVDFDQVTGTAVIDGGTKQVAQLELRKGKYALVCFIADRAGGPPHVAKGMLQEVEVE
jgi:hypothetical protein